jgi:hypothetical protein
MHGTSNGYSTVDHSGKFIDVFDGIGILVRINNLISFGFLHVYKIKYQLRLDFQFTTKCLVNFQFTTKCLVNFQFTTKCLVNFQFTTKCLVNFQFTTKCLVLLI